MEGQGRHGFPGPCPPRQVPPWSGCRHGLGAAQQVGDLRGLCPWVTVPGLGSGLHVRPPPGFPAPAHREGGEGSRLEVCGLAGICSSNPDSPPRPPFWAALCCPLAERPGAGSAGRLRRASRSRGSKGGGRPLPPTQALRGSPGRRRPSPRPWFPFCEIRALGRGTRSDCFAGAGGLGGDEVFLSYTEVTVAGRSLLNTQNH